MMHLDERTQGGIDACLDCYRTCFGMLMGHCVETGGEHVAPAHVRSMSACAEICRTTAHFMLMQSRHAPHLARECAEICQECATECERVGDMDACVRACRACAEACRRLAS